MMHHPQKRSLGRIIIEPTQDILVLFVLCKLILQTRMRSHLALFSLRTESDNPDATCALSH